MVSSCAYLRLFFLLVLVYLLASKLPQLKMCFPRASTGISPLTLWPLGSVQAYRWMPRGRKVSALVLGGAVVGWWLGLHWGARKGEAWSKLVDLMDSSRLSCHANHLTKLCLATSH